MVNLMKINDMNLDSYKKIISAYIAEFINGDVSAIQVYNYIKEESYSDVYSIIDALYNKYGTLLKMDYEVYNQVFNNILLDIKKNIKNINDNLFDDKLVIEKLKKQIQSKEEHNFEKMTYPLFLFTKNLYYDLVKNNAKTVYFFAREGQFMKTLFDIFQNSVVGPKIKSEYLYVSRASTFLGTLKSIKQEKFDSLFIQYSNMSLTTFCQNISFKEKDILELESLLKIDFKKEIIDIKNSQEFKLLTKNAKFIQKYDNIRETAKELFIRYLDQFGNDYKKKMFVVDVGWKGTIQNNIQKILPKTKIMGYYLGLVHYADITNYETKKAILFENTLSKKSKNGYLYNSNRSIFEVILAADHGSTINYKAGKRIVPVLNNQDKEKELFINNIKPIQNNIINKFTKLVDILKYSYYDVFEVEKLINHEFFKLMFKPSKNEINEYNTFYHFENFGVMNYSFFKKNNKITLKQKLKNYRHFRAFIQNDDSWQYLKLHNNKMHLGKIVLYFYKKRSFKKQDVI